MANPDRNVPVGVLRPDWHIWVVITATEALGIIRERATEGGPLFDYEDLHDDRYGTFEYLYDAIEFSEEP